MKKSISLIVLIVVAALFPIHAYAHSGGTDSKGGHYNRSTGEYHYHHGYSAHQHKDMDGDGDLDCPYEFDNKDYYKELPKATIDPNLLKEMEEWHNKIQEYTYPEEHTQSGNFKETKQNDVNASDHKVTLKTAADNNLSNSPKKTTINWYDIPIYVIGFSAFLMLFSPMIGYWKPGLTEYIFELSLKAIVIALPFWFLFELLFIVFE